LESRESPASGLESRLVVKAGTVGQLASGRQRSSVCVVCGATVKSKCAAESGCELGWKTTCDNVSKGNSETLAVQLEQILQSGIKCQLQDFMQTFQEKVGWWARVKTHEEFKLMIGVKDLYQHMLSLTVEGRQLLSQEVRTKLRRIQSYKWRQFNKKITAVNSKKKLQALIANGEIVAVVDKRK